MKYNLEIIGDGQILERGIGLDRKGLDEMYIKNGMVPDVEIPSEMAIEWDAGPHTHIFKDKFYKRIKIKVWTGK